MFQPNLEAEIKEPLPRYKPASPIPHTRPKKKPVCANGNCNL